MPANRADAAALKKEGNDAMKRGAYKAAVEAYTAAIDLWMENSDAILYPNRAAARLKMPGEATKALSDAERVRATPTYAKAHFRRGQALRALKKDIPAARRCTRCSRSRQAMPARWRSCGRCRSWSLRAVAPPPAPPQEPPRAPTPPQEPPPQSRRRRRQRHRPLPHRRRRARASAWSASSRPRRPQRRIGEVLPATKPGERVPVRLDDKRESLLLQPRNLVVLADDPEPTER